MPDKKSPHRKAPRRAVKPDGGGEHRISWPYFERVTATRFRLKADPARTLYAILQLLSDEHAAQVSTLGAAGVAIDPARVGMAVFHRHAASAFRMAADRLLKTFTLDAMINAERYGMEQFAAAVANMNKNHAAPAA